jgi:hypothetical protein
MESMRLIRGLLASLLVGLLLVAGCWGSKITLIPPDQAKVNRAYVGNWDAVSTSGDHTSLVIRNIDGKLYYIETRDKDAKDINRYIGFIADVKGATFAHVKPLEEDGDNPEEWILMRVAIADNKLTLEQMKEDFFKDKKIESPAQLRQILESNLNNEAMYHKEAMITATRVAK